MKFVALFVSLLIGSSAAVAEQQRRGGTEAQYASILAFHDETVARFNEGDLEGSVNDYLERLRVAHTQGMSITGRDGLQDSWGKALTNPETKPVLLSEIIEMEINGILRKVLLLMI